MSTLKPRKIWFDETVQRLNVDSRGELLGEFKSDDKVLVNSGPLSKLEGTVDQIKGNKAILNIESLGIVIHAEVSLNRIEKIA